MDVKRVHQESHGIYGARRVWKQLLREDVDVGRCTVEGLMRRLGLSGLVRGRKARATWPADVTARPLDLVQRRFVAERPNQLWVSDLTYVATWENRFAYVAFVTDVFSRKVVGWRVSRSLRTDLALDALEQALHARRDLDGLVHHSDRGSQYLALRYTERLAEANIETSVGSICDSHDNALAESIDAFYEAEKIERDGPWRSVQAVELATLEWVAWWNERRLHGALDDVPPAAFERDYWLAQGEPAKALTSATPGGLAAPPSPPLPEPLPPWWRSTKPASGEPRAHQGGRWTGGSVPRWLTEGAFKSCTLTVDANADGAGSATARPSEAVAGHHGPGSDP